MIDNKDMGLHDFVSIEQLTREECESIIERATFFEKNGYETVLEGRVIASLFFEASTRTRLSFETAIHRLGGSVIGFADPEATSMNKKGESFEDTIRMIDGYADAIVIRHPENGSAQKAADIATIPVVNAGDGSNQHPTQTLLDLYAIQKTQSSIDGLTVALVGDLQYGRVPHSLAKALTLFDSVTQLWVSPQELVMPQNIRDYVSEKGSHIEETRKIEDVIERADIIYMTRVQSDRFQDQEAYEKLKDVYVLDVALLEHAKPTMKILHALPRLYEIPESIDCLEHAYYFEQARSGVPVRAAILEALLK